MTSVTGTQEPTRRGGRGARQRIMNAASELFHRDGINAKINACQCVPSF